MSATEEGKILINTFDAETVTNKGAIPVCFQDQVKVIKKTLESLDDLQNIEKLKIDLFKRSLRNLINFTRNYQWFLDNIEKYFSDTSRYLEYTFRHIIPLENYFNPHAFSETDPQEIREAYEFINNFIARSEKVLLKLDHTCFEPVIILRKKLNPEESATISDYIGDKYKLNDIPNATLFHLLKTLESNLSGQEPKIKKPVNKEVEGILKTLLQKYENICLNPEIHIPGNIDKIREVRHNRLIFTQQLLDKIIGDAISYVRLLQSQSVS